MNQIRKIYVVGGDNVYANWMQGVVVNTMEEADLVLFTGGEDVNPSVYDEVANHTTYFNSERDEFEFRQFKDALNAKKIMIGICRGSQFLCAMAGGKLVQNMGNQGYLHRMIDVATNEEIHVTSSHHQAQYPWFLPLDAYKIIGHSGNIVKTHQGGKYEEMNIGQATKVLGHRFMKDNNDLPEVEIGYYPKIKALCIQSHPEYEFNAEHAGMIDYMRGLLDKHMAGAL